MTSPLSIPRLPAALFVLVQGLAAGTMPALATSAYRVPVVVCVPADSQTMANELKLALPGVARQAGRDPPPRAYYCPVFNPDFTTPHPTWRKLKLMYQDSTGLAHNIVVRLYAKDLAGVTTQIADVKSVPALGVNTVWVWLPTWLDFSKFSYYTRVEMTRPAGIVPDLVDVHEVQLTD